jgi:hypothetical protein
VAGKGNTTTQGTDPQAFDVTGASSVSYITSFLPGAAKPTTMSEADLNKQLLSMTPQERIAYATRLKAAGYPVGPINGAVTKDLRQSWLNAHSDLQTEIQAGQALDLNTFLTANAGTGSGSSGPKTVTQTSLINDTAATSLINSLFQDLTGFKATEKQIADYTKKLREAQAANPTKTTYSASGSSSTTGGLDTQQFLTEQVGQTDAAVKSRATDAYTLMMQELGGLR